MATLTASMASATRNATTLSAAEAFTQATASCLWAIPSIAIRTSAMAVLTNMVARPSRASAAPRSPVIERAMATKPPRAKSIAFPEFRVQGTKADVALE